MRIAFRLLLSCVATVAILAACGGGSLSQNEGQVRLVNATGEFGALDLYESSNRLSSGVAAFTASGYQGLDKGNHDFSVRGGVAGATIATLAATVAKDKHLAIVAYSNGGTPTLALLDEEADPPSSGSAKLRFFNTTASDSGSVDVYLVADATACSALAATAATPVATAVSGLQTAYTTINPSTATGYHLCVTAATDKSDVRLDTQLVVADRQVVTVILSRTSGVLLNGLVLVQQGNLTQGLNASARVRLAVGVTAGNTVTASVGTVSLGAATAPRSVGSYKLVPAGTVTADVSISGGTSVPTSLTLVGGADYTLLVAGTNTTPTLTADNNSLSANAAKPVKIRLLNGANGALTGGTLGPAMLTVGSTLLDSTEFAAASPYVFIESSTATAILFDVRTTNGTVLCTSSSTLPAAPSVFTVFVLGDPQTPVPPCLLRADR